jgi:hypothetical protein
MKLWERREDETQQEGELNNDIEQGEGPAEEGKAGGQGVVLK